MDDVQDAGATVAAETAAAQPASETAAAPAETTAVESAAEPAGPAVNVSGDAEGGWVVDISDGDTHSTHTCMAPNEQDAVALAVAERQLNTRPAGHDRVAHLEAQVAQLSKDVAQLASRHDEHATTLAEMVDADHSLSNRIHSTGLRVDVLEAAAKDAAAKDKGKK